MKQKITFFCAAGFAICQFLHAGQSPTIPGRMEVRLNDAWRFERAENPTNASSPDAPEAAAAFNDAGWDRVFLPHTPRIEPPESAGKYFQGVCWYRRHIAPDAAWRGKKVSLLFEGAMQVAEVWVNGRHMFTHCGGYLPFSVDLTGALAEPGGAVVGVRLDNTDQPEIPPGKKHNQLDFCYFGGLYRNVKLVVTDPLHITDAVAANRVAAGGVFVRTESVSSGAAKIFAQADVLNEGAGETNVSVRFTALAPSREKVAVGDVKISALATGDDVVANCLLTISHPQLWHPDHPWLYTLKTELLRDGQAADAVSTRFGIRTLAYDDKLGFVLNGQPQAIRGANRHQDFPWLGNAVPDNAARRDLKRLKDAGFNFLRLAHYPQSSAVMEACDELGLMVAVCTPGWQHFSQTETFVRLAKQDIRDMVRWHRNHPCAIMWEVSLNETYGHDQFHAECARIAREEYPGGQLFTSGDSYGSKDVSFYDIPYCGWTGRGYDRPAAPGFEGRKRSFIREYGDNDSAINNRIYLGGDADQSEWQQLNQAWAYQWTHNVNNGSDWSIGNALWCGVDAATGAGARPVSGWGVLNYVRQPKFSFYFFQSQRPQELPSIFIANYWTPRPSPAKVVVYANCDEVELVLNGRTLGRQRPDNGSDSDMGDAKAEDAMLINYMKTGKTIRDFEKMVEERGKQEKKFPINTGGDCKHLDHAPFTFPLVPFEAGELKAVGYIGSKPVVAATRHTPGKPAKLKLEAALEGLPLAADGADAVFVRATVCDADGNLVPGATNSVGFTLSGKAQFVSPTAARAEAGVASVLIRSGGLAAGKVSLRATAPGLESARAELNAK